MWRILKAEYFTKKAWLALAVFFVIDIGIIWLFNDVVILKKLFPIRPEIGIYALAFYIFLWLYGNYVIAMEENRTKLHALLPLPRINLNVGRLLIPLYFVILYIILSLTYLSLTFGFVEHWDYYSLLKTIFFVLASCFGVGFILEFGACSHRRGVGNFFLNVFGMMIPYFLLFNLINDTHILNKLEMILVISACLIITAIYIVLIYKGFKGRKSFLN